MVDHTTASDRSTAPCPEGAATAVTAREQRLLAENERLRHALIGVLGTHVDQGRFPRPLDDLVAMLSDLYESEITAHMVICAAYAHGIDAPAAEVYAWAATDFDILALTHQYIDPAIDAIQEAAAAHFSARRPDASRA